MRKALIVPFSKRITLLTLSRKFLSGNYALTPQLSFGNRRKGFHLRSEIHDIKKIDLSWPKEKIERHIRATMMPGFEGPYTDIGNRKIKFEMA